MENLILVGAEDGLIDVIVRPQVYSRYRGILHKARLLLVEGKVQSKGGVINVLAHRMAAIAIQESAIAPFVENTIRNFQLAQTAYRPL